MMKKANQDSRAKAMGAEFVEAKKFAPKAGGKGLKSTFKFDDITKLKLNADGGLSELTDQAGGGGGGDEEDQAYKFGFTKGATSKLTVKSPPMDSQMVRMKTSTLPSSPWPRTS